MQIDAPRSSESCERKIIYLLCLLAALHVLIFSAAFPFFSIVDEEHHFDLVTKYAQGQAPRTAASFGAEAAHDITLYNSPEYLAGPAYYQAVGHLTPQWTWPASDEKVQQAVAEAQAVYQKEFNYESSQPPLYYGLAAVWWNLGKTLGLTGLHLLYWLRFLNVFFVVLLVWAGYAVAREIFPDNAVLKLGVPAMLAFLPQRAFYSVDNDILSPLCCGILLLFLLKWSRAEIPNALSGLAVGLSMAAVFLAKTSNLPLLALASFAVLWKIWQLGKLGKLSAAWKSLAILLCTAALPIAAWMTWCRIHFGDLTGAGPKMHSFGWTVKPFSNWWHHPIFTPSGLWVFMFRSLTNFWSGECLWHQKPLYFAPFNWVCVLGSLIFMLAAVPAIFTRSAKIIPSQKWMLGVLLVCIFAEFGFFAFLSIIYDFHDCPNPSRAEPYFTAGRLMLGTLIPFLLVCVFQFDRFLGWHSLRTKLMTLGLFILFMLACEITTDWPVFFSQYNLYHY
ncbi:MAG TPA: DUF2142 domain-containing protein [Verrucomicrobiae bacterium]|jgi:hypothetical protein